MDVYLIVLMGQGDVDVRVVDKESFDWVNSINMGRPAGSRESSWVDSCVPESQRALWRAAGEESDELIITIGSWQNDRALAAQSMSGFDHYNTLAAALKAIYNAQARVVDTYEGMIY